MHYYIIIVDRGVKHTDIIRTTSRKLFDTLSQCLRPFRPIRLSVDGWQLHLYKWDRYTKMWTGRQFWSEVLAD